MPNAVLESLLAQRAEQIATMDAILSQVDGRDLVDAERGLLEATRDRIIAIDDQLRPIEEYENMRAAHASRLASLEPARLTVPAQPRRIDAGERDFPYEGAGDFLVDYVRAQGIVDRGRRDEQAMARIQQSRAAANQITSDTPGILPTPIVGAVVNLIDANRPLLTSLGGAKALGAIPGATFSRPIITQHTTVGPQTAEKTELPSQKMTIAQIQFAKKTYGGTVDISRQDMDWTSPSAWDILVNDLANVYARETEGAVADDFTTNAGGTAVPLGTAGTAPSLAEWSTALYTAAMRSYNASFRMPDRVWCSVDVWAALGSLVDTARLVMPPAQTEQPAGTTSLADFRGDVIGLPRIVVPMFSDGTCIVGPSNLYEAYEEVIGLLSVIEPSILGVEVAYGGYLAFGSLHPGAFVPLQIAGTLPTIAPNGNGSRRGNGGASSTS
jgi:HK97 family phage major capsid protein